MVPCNNVGAVTDRPLFLVFLPPCDIIKEKGSEIVKHSKKDIDQYLEMYPNLQKWVNHCPICGARGRKSEMPNAIGAMYGEIAANRLRRMLPVLEVDKGGFCLVCSRLYHK